MTDWDPSVVALQKMLSATFAIVFAEGLGVDAVHAGDVGFRCPIAGHRLDLAAMEQVRCSSLRAILLIPSELGSAQLILIVMGAGNSVGRAPWATPGVATAAGLTSTSS